MRSGARASMPGMMDTILNLGLNDESVEDCIMQIMEQEKADKDTGAKKPVTIYEPEAEVVREIYFKYLIGYTYREIIRDLDERGIKPSCATNKSGFWQSSTINM